MASPSKRPFRTKWFGLMLVSAITALALLGVGSAGGAFRVPTGSASGTASAPPTSKTAKQAAALPAGVVTHYLHQTAAQALAFWTPARMAAAKPVDVMTRAGTPASVPPTKAVSGTPQKASGWTPANLSAGPAVVNPAQASPKAAATPESQCFQCFIPFTRYYYFARYRTYPVSTVGKLFFSNDGGNYVCSASVIYFDTLDTAGHCVANTDGTHQWDSSAVFCPSYNAGENFAVGCWAANYFVTTSTWLNTGSLEWDFGGINTSTCGDVHCTDIGNVTGYLGVAWNQAEDQNWTAFGYPQASPFDGNYIVVANSEFGYEDSDGNNQGGPNSIAMGNDMTGGSSGGPWILGFGGGNWVNGHNDWRWNSLPNSMNSPYVNSSDCSVWSVAGRSDITC